MSPVWRERLKRWFSLEVIQAVVLILGVPSGLWTYYEAKQKERLEAEWMAYEKMDERYWMYERMAMEHPQLGVSDATVSDPALAKLVKPRGQLTPAEMVRERQMMIMLIAMYERAFILYADQSSELKARQWAGWENGLKRWAKEPNFREAWARIGVDFDAEYGKLVNKLMKQKS
jgi:hypothetical protein